jgi:hypothetical protein
MHHTTITRARTLGDLKESHFEITLHGHVIVRT